MSPGPKTPYKPEAAIPDEFEVDLPNHREGWPPVLISIVDFADETLQDNVINLAAGTPGAQTDPMDILRNKVEILAKSTDGKPSSALADDYGQKIAKVDDIKTKLHDHNVKVDSSSYSTYKTSNTTFNFVIKKIRALEDTLGTSDGPTAPSPYISPTTLTYLLNAIFDTLGAVHDKIASAIDDIQGDADRIHRSTPSYGAPSYAAPSYGARQAPLPLPRSNGEYAAGPARDKVDVAIKAAWGELARGVHETNGNNHVDAPYNIDDAWCASFATWAWKEAGIDVDWSNKNYVPAIWADAGRLRDNISAAAAGDLLIWGDQGHIGLVVARNGNMITTIEGNSGDQVAEHTYDITKGGFAGVVHPPAGSRSPGVGSLQQTAV
ncbi:CHAP domain-containing protein [Nocardia sp. NPDC051463]|uniref:CHAP domain-containing protein n=1 Tax=Nocardia sp. NPDC051463 TaxID=3154845 RepID=UPI00342B354E